MKHLMLLPCTVLFKTILLGFLCTQCVAQGKFANGQTSVPAKALHNTTDEEQLAQLNAQFIKNFIAMDTVAHNQIIHKDFRCVTGKGEIVDRATYMREWSSSYFNSGFTSFRHSDVSIRLFGVTALVYSRTHFEKSTEGKKVMGSSAYVDTYVKENGRWWCVQAQLAQSSINN